MVPENSGHTDIYEGGEYQRIWRGNNDQERKPEEWVLMKVMGKTPGSSSHMSMDSVPSVTAAATCMTFRL